MNYSTLRKPLGLLVVLCILFSAGKSFGQESLRPFILGEKGKTQTVARLAPTQQVQFNGQLQVLSYAQHQATR